jgi:hypothetical protein
MWTPSTPEDARLPLSIYDLQSSSSSVSFSSSHLFASLRPFFWTTPNLPHHSINQTKKRRQESKIIASQFQYSSCTSQTSVSMPALLGLHPFIFSSFTSFFHLRTASIIVPLICLTSSFLAFTWYGSTQWPRLALRRSNCVPLDPLDLFLFFFPSFIILVSLSNDQEEKLPSPPSIL